MPNHITNKVSVFGNASNIREMFATIKGGKEQDFRIIDFNKIVPMPETLNVTSGTSVDNAIAILKKDEDYFKKMLEYPWVKEEKIKSVSKLIERISSNLTEKDFEEARMSIMNLELYGHSNWYDWSVANWGTKWNSYDNFKLSDHQFKFDTAWATPFPVMLKLSEMFPELEFVVRFADEDIGVNCGMYGLSKGKLINEQMPKGYEAIKFAYKVKGWDNGLMEFLCSNLTNLNEADLEEAKEDIVEILTDDDDDDVADNFINDAFYNHDAENLSNLKVLLTLICVQYELYELISKVESYYDFYTKQKNIQ